MSCQAWRQQACIKSLPKGFGLSDTDVAKGTKILLLAPNSMDTQAKMCSIFSMLLALMLGEKAPATMAFLEQCHNFWDNKESNHMRAVVDATSPLQVAVYLDCCFQLYLGNCMHTKNPDDINEKWLLLHLMQNKIMLGMFHVQNVPSFLWHSSSPSHQVLANNMATSRAMIPRMTTCQHCRLNNKRNDAIKVTQSPMMASYPLGKSTKVTLVSLLPGY